MERPFVLCCAAIILASGLAQGQQPATPPAGAGQSITTPTATPPKAALPPVAEKNTYAGSTSGCAPQCCGPMSAGEGLCCGTAAGCEAGPCGGSSGGDGACGPPGHIWVRGEYLLWWTKSSPLPPLVTTSPVGTPVGEAGVLGQPGTSILFGGHDVSDNPRSGGRITAGGWLNDCQTIGVEGYFFGLESASNGFSAASNGNPILARPFFNAATGLEDNLLIAFPGSVRGNVDVKLSQTNLYGWGADVRANVCCGCCYRVDLLGGYRGLSMDEGLGLTESEIGVGPNSPVPVGTRIDLADSFRTSNHFNGGDLGVDAEVRRGRFYVDLLARVALGDTSESVGVTGNTSIQGGPPLPGGFLALPTNGGSFHKDTFAVVPEVGLTAGYQVTDHLRVFTGYTFLYWSKVARPGDQVDLAINPSQLPPGRLVGPARPAFILHDTDFWAQGVNFGAELRF